MRADAGELAALNDEILVADRLVGEVALQDLSDACRVPCLGRERGAGDMRRHAVMRHGAPGMILGCGLREPDVAGIACELSALQRAHDRIPIAELTAGGIDEISAP